MGKVQYLKTSALGLLTLVVSACVYDPVYYGPPPHITVGGYYQPWGYYYYPGVNVYFHYATGVYFYFSNGIWVRTRVLPATIRLNPRDRVHLHIENDRPYLFHEQHRDMYRPRPQPGPPPQLDRREREDNRYWYEQQREYREKYHSSPGPGQKSDKRQPREEEEEKRRRP
ncbi:MAG: hypothetical protein R6X06_03445 [Gammaproteobacteria bacterium]